MDNFLESELKTSEWLDEAFGGGKASSVVIKLGNILSKKIGKKILFTTVPLQYSNDYGEFAGYIGKITDRDYLKINFKLTGSDTITSFDIYNSGPVTPTYTIDTEGLNIVQIVNLLVENLMEDEVVSINESVSKDALEERGRPTGDDPEAFLPMMNKWITEEPDVLKTLQDKPVPEIFSNYFLRWAQGKPRYENIKYYNFTKILKRFLLERGLTNRTYRKRKKGSKERQIKDPILQSQLEDIAEGITWQEKFEFLRGSIAQMGAGRVQSIYLYGDPGSGKTFEVEKTLKDQSLAYKIYSGGVKGIDELVRILYNHRDNEILVFDDFADKLLKNQDVVNILKAALQNAPSRTITYADVRRDSNKGMSDIPPQFEFSSGIIFISNYAKLESAIASRSLVLELSFSNEEVLEKISQTLANFRPEVPMAKKKEALEYAQELAPGVKSIDYRMIDNILVAMDISPSNWKKMSLLLMQSAGM